MSFSDTVALFSSVIFGRAIKNEHLALGTIFSTAAIAFAASGGKKEAPAPKGQTLVEKVKEAVPINAGSRCVTFVSFTANEPKLTWLSWFYSEEEQLYVSFTYLFSKDRVVDN